MRAIVVAGTHSGAGKTTVATGLMAALRAAGHRVAPFKVGPDYIDPGYHALAAQRPSRNLDTWMCSPPVVRGLFALGAAGADIAVIEGVMGLFDGAASDGERASTAEVAKLLGAPVVLVVDASGMARSAAAVVHGFATFDPGLHLAGIVWNRVGSPWHRQLLDEAVAPLGIPVLGALPRDDRLAWRDRHLGLVPVAEQPAEVAASVGRLAAVVADGIDLPAVVAAANEVEVAAVWDPTADGARAPAGTTVAMAGGPAFSFAYPETAEAFAAAGAAVVPFDPRLDERLPAGSTHLFVGGGFPEVYGEDLAANARLRADVAMAIDGGLAVWGECAGLMWLARSLDGRPMVGAVPLEVEMTGRLTLGYREATAAAASPLGPPAMAVRGHEFHYSAVRVPSSRPAWNMSRGGDGYAAGRVVAGYLHLHPGAGLAPFRNFVTMSA